MPKRIVDGEALWLSDKVRSLPEEFRLHYANWIPLARENGVFEADPHRIQAQIYGYLKPNFNVKAVQRLLNALVRAGLIRLYDAEGKTWGYFVGIDKPGRLPEMRYIDRYKNLPPNPPQWVIDGTSPD